MGKHELTLKENLKEQLLAYFRKLFKEKIFDRFPKIDRVAFGCGDKSSSPYRFYTWTDSFLEVDGVDLYNDKEEKWDKLAKYFPFGDMEYKEGETDNGQELGEIIFDIFDGDFPELFAAFLFLGGLPNSSSDANTLTVYRDGKIVFS